MSSGLLGGGLGALIGAPIGAISNVSVDSPKVDKSDPDYATKTNVVFKYLRGLRRGLISGAVSGALLGTSLAASHNHNEYKKSLEPPEPINLM